MRRALASLIGLALFGAAIWIIAQEVERVGWPALRRDFRSIPGSVLVGAAALTAVAYAFLTTYDVLAFRYIGHRLARRKIMLAAFIGYAFSNSISMTPSMAARYRLYSSWGLRPSEIAQVFAFHYLSTWLGFLAVGGAIFLIEPTPISRASFLTFGERRWIGAGLLALLAAYFVASALLKKGLRVRGTVFRPPPHRLLLEQVAVATLDWALVGVIPYLLLEGWRHLSYLSFLSVFLLAQVLQIVSHVPGGIGVFEGTVLVLLRSEIPASQLLAGLLVYRVIYTLFPLVLAAPAFLLAQLRSTA